MFSRTLRSAAFLIKAPILLVFLFFVNLLTSPGHWWIQWAVLGIGIAWVFALIRVVWAIIIGGGLAAFAAYWMNRERAGQSANPAAAGAPPRHPDIPVMPTAKQ